MEKIGCLVIHGFGGNVQEIRPLAEQLQEMGCRVVCPELAGHTGRRRDLAAVTCRDWIQSAELELARLRSECDRVVLIGFSMGGLIAVNLAVRHEVQALVTLNMPIFHWDLKRIAYNLLSDLRCRRFANLRRYVHSTYALPFPALLQFKLLLARTKKLLGRVTCPSFIAQALEDDTVQHRSAEYAHRQLGSKTRKVKYYSGSGHLICHSRIAPEVFRDVVDFINEIIGSNKS